MDDVACVENIRRYRDDEPCRQAFPALEIARTFAYGGKKGRPMEASIEHFHENCCC